MGSQLDVCAACGDAIGVYEPLKLVDGQGRVVTTSLLREQDAGDRDAPRMLFHAGCYERKPGAGAA